jgi:hypothetical protein
MYAKTEAIDAVVPAGAATVITTITTDMADGDLVIAVTNTGAVALDAFTCEVQPVAGGPWVTIDVATPAQPCAWVTTALATLAAAASSAFSVNANGIHAVRISASGNGGATTMSVWSSLGG